MNACMPRVHLSCMRGMNGPPWRRCGSQAIVVLRREQAFASVRAPKLLGSATLLTEFPPFDVQKRAVTQAQASALATPLVTGTHLISLPKYAFVG